MTIQAAFPRARRAIPALLGIANTLALSTLERTHELGLLLAVGMTRPQLRSAVRWESVLIALFGALLLSFAPARAQDYTYGVEINGVLCGYVETHISKHETGAYTLVTEKVFVVAARNSGTSTKLMVADPAPYSTETITP